LETTHFFLFVKAMNEAAGKAGKIKKKRKVRHVVAQEKARCSIGKVSPRSGTIKKILQQAEKRKPSLSQQGLSL
jgi:hypothetical protein